MREVLESLGFEGLDALEPRLGVSRWLLAALALTVFVMIFHPGFWLDHGLHAVVEDVGPML